MGGDLYDYFLHKGHLVFCIGDVSGKGVPAALLMAVMRSMFRSEARRADNAADIVNAMNRNFCEEYTGGDFITMFVGILNLKTGHLDYCNAAHEAPIIAGRPLDIKPNLPVGALSDWNYEGQEAQLQPGDMIFLYTDGLSEAMNTKYEQFGREHVEKLAKEHCTDTARQLVTFMIDMVRRHAGDAEQSDDITMMAIRWKDDGGGFFAMQSGRAERKVDGELSLHSSMEDIGRLEPFIAHVAEQAGISDLDAKRLRLAVEEAVANTINHGQATIFLPLTSYLLLLTSYLLPLTSYFLGVKP